MKPEPLKPAETRIDKIIRETFAQLEAHGADPTNPHSREVRYTANFIVRKSPLAPLFRAMGILNGQDLGRSFYLMPDVRFFEHIFFVYYIYKINRFFYCGFERDTHERLVYYLEAHNPDRFATKVQEIRDEYFDMRRAMRRERDLSMDKTGSKKFNDYSPAKMLEAVRYSSKATWWEWDKKFRNDLSHAEYAMACLFRGETSMSAYNYVREYANHTHYGFVSNGYLRAMLSHWHGFKIPTRGTEEPIVTGMDKALSLHAQSNPTSEDDWKMPDMIEYITGFTHEELELDATEFQDDIKRKLDLMENWEMLEGENYFDVEPRTDDMIEELVYDTESEILTSGSLTSASVPQQIMDLAEKLAEKHGPVTISKEASGIHIYIADPDLLRTDGAKEFSSKHLAINADKYLGLNDYDVDLHPTTQNRLLYNKYRRRNKEIPSAISMKTKKVYMVSDLLRYLPIAQRGGLFNNIKAQVSVGSVRKRLVYDENGNLVPEWCGDTVPLHELPENHPAREYLAERGYNIHLLENQFEACYCKAALPESRGEGRYYSRLPGGMVNSPQGRIIFSVRMNGVRLGYQSRYIDKWVGNKYYFWSHTEKWMLIRERNEDGAMRELYPPTDQFPKGFSPHKYLNATGSERNKLLMGFDAAVEFNKSRPFAKRYCVLVEGPLDAAKIGPPAIALLGKSMSQYQAAEIQKNFSKVITVMDNDEAGRQCLDRIYRMLPSTPIQNVPVPDHVKDIGELTYMEAYNLVSPYDPIIST